jgi:hypothetical protein
MADEHRETKTAISKPGRRPVKPRAKETGTKHTKSPHRVYDLQVSPSSERSSLHDCGYFLTCLLIRERYLGYGTSNAVKKNRPACDVQILGEEATATFLLELYNSMSMYLETMRNDVDTISFASRV